MKTRAPWLAVMLLLLACALLVPTLASAVASDPVGNLQNPRVAPPGSTPYGKTYGEWSMAWWQWAYSLPTSGHPLFDESGADCGTGQSGPVWFLGGVFNVSGVVTRSCNVPSGVAILFPIVNAEWDNFCPPIDPPATVDSLRELVRQSMNGATLSCELDGVPIQNLEQYRFTSPVFSVTIPDGNIWQFFGCPIPAGTYGPLVGDGYYLMLRPLSAGSHTLHFKGTVAGFGGFTPEATYHLTVGASNSPRKANGRLQTTWGLLRHVYQ